MHSSQGFILQEDSYTYYSMGDGVEEAQDTPDSYLVVRHSTSYELTTRFLHIFIHDHSKVGPKITRCTQQPTHLP